MHTDSSTKTKKLKSAKKKSGHKHDLDNADPEKLTATERAKIKKLKKEKKKKKKHAAAVDVEFHSTLQYPADDEDDIGLDDEVERPRNVFGDDDDDDDVDDVDDVDDDSDLEGALTGADDEVTGAQLARSIRTGSKATSSTQVGSAKANIPATTSNTTKADVSGNRIPQIKSNVNGLLPPLSVPASVTNMLTQLTPKRCQLVQQSTQQNQSGGTHSTAFAASLPSIPAANANTQPVQTASSANVASTASVQQSGNTSKIGQSLGERMAAASFADLPPDERVAKLAASGLSNEQISLRTGLSLQQVMNTRKTVATKTLIGDPRKLFADRLADFDEAFVEARRNYHDDPGSEIYYRAMNDFAKTMRDLVKDYTDLEDPQEVALGIVNSSLRPFVLKVLKSVVDNMNAALRTVAPYLREQERVLLADNVRVGMKTLQDSVNVEYNKAVTGLEQLYGVDLTDVKAASSKPPEIEGSSIATKSTDSGKEAKLN